MHAVGGERLARALLEHAHRELEHRAAVHLERGIALDRAAAHVAGRVEDARVAAVGMQVRWRGCPAVSEASSTTAPAPSPKSTQVPRSFQSRMRENTSAPTTSAHLCAPGADEEVGGGERVDEARAHRLHVEGGAALHAELRLQQAGARREHHVGRGRGERR